MKDKKPREPILPVAAKIRPGTDPKVEVAKRLGELGMMAMAASPSNVIAMAPAMIVTGDDIDEGVAIMDEALDLANSYACPP